VTKLKERLPVHYHKKASRTPIPLSLTGHPSMLHFMAFSIDSNAFSIASGSVFKNGLLYHNKTWNQTATMSLEQHSTSNSLVLNYTELPEISGSTHSTDKPCGGIQIMALELNGWFYGDRLRGVQSLRSEIGCGTRIIELRAFFSLLLHSSLFRVLFCMIRTIRSSPTHHPCIYIFLFQR